MSDRYVTPVSISTADMNGWWIEMRSTSFGLWGPHTTAPGRHGYFQRCELGYRFPFSDVEAAWESMRQASRWFRKEWRPDFTLAHPYGIGRALHVRRVGDWIELHADFFETDDETDVLEFSYTELPGLRAAIARRARPRRKRQAKEHDGNP